MEPTGGSPADAAETARHNPSPLTEARDRLAGQVLAGTLSPNELPARYTEAADEYLTALLQEAVEEGEKGYALIAVGGYGRVELSPGSDLDVVLLHDKKRGIKKTADAIWYRVWDTGVRLDHSVRTRSEMLDVATSDLRALLGLLDGRVVSGDQGLGEAVLAKVDEYWRRHHRNLLPSLESATVERHRSFGELPYLLEPDLKESAGGLRDLEAMSLVARALPALDGILRPPSLASARALLLSARVVLHARTGNHSDRVLLQEQDEIARVLDFADADEFAAALAARGREVMWASDDGWRRTRSVLHGPPRRGGGRPIEVDNQIVSQDGEIALVAGADPASDPSLVFRVAVAATRHDLPIAISTLERLAKERPELGTPWPEAVREAFISLLEYGHASTRVIETLDRYGLFEWILPEWAVVRHRPQRNAYHRFTVDRHLLEAAAEAAALIRSVERPDLLLLGALLHDIGKGRPGDHSEVGRAIATGIVRRMGYPARDIAVIERLVKRHLLLADVATRRDIEDPETIELVAEAVGDPDTLELLAAVTKADSVATGHLAWGSWKESLVNALVENVRAFFEGRQVDHQPWRKVRPEILALAEAGELAVVVDGPSVTVVAPDRPGLFALVAGTLAIHRLDIRRASALGLAGEIASGVGREASEECTAESKAMAVEVFEVEHDPTRPIEQEALRAALARALAGDLAIGSQLRTLEEAYANYRRPTAAHSPEVVVLLDETASAASALVEVRAPDSRGLLHRLALVIAEHGFDVVSARIATLGHEVVDSFYVREQRTGARPGRDRLEELRLALIPAATTSRPTGP